MSKTIALPDEVYAQLEQRASQRGLKLPQIIAALVHEDEHSRITGAIERMRTKGVLLMPSSAIPPAPIDFIPLRGPG